MQKNKLYSILLSFVISFGMWFYVVTNVSVEDEITFNDIPVVLEREAALAENNLIITNQSVQSISLRLSGARSDLNKVNRGNITVKVDVSKIEEPGEKIGLKPSITYPPDVPSGAFVEESRSTNFIYFDVDTRRTKEVPVIIQWTGTRSGDYLYDTENAVLDYPMITVVGPAEVADQIDHAMIEIDLSGQTESLSESYRYTLCNTDGEPVDAKQIVTNAEEVHVDMNVQRIKEVEMVVNVVYGGGATELNTLVTVEPEVIRLSGSEAILAELGDTYTVCTLNLAEVEKSQDLKYAITLPEGVTNQTGVSEAVVTVRFSGLSTREFTVENIEIVNVPEGMEAEIISNTLENVKMRGPASEISLLTADDLTAVVDFSAATAGNATYKATIKASDKFANVGALKTYSVSATVRAAED